ncbi:phenylalanine--tRNA ligase beta subunit-related protein [Streptosporangium sp. NBC_01755]|uniref:B3/B4 domain-containing protein n=1 Tax=unclassified Streptosporangium TaxID=2632669 RepID=UPI002DD91FA6|nr:MULTISPECIES: phenylalanine--tRNA ligase beta subunit-related protein [unclassified Streptosporangium]WSA26381.1 phenylalanine--tRNA ligase beta subunit-related protein [Streptosporangium sp. NBC_01810]WSD02189.1 phenylalanine--tRNA ligase beta subunit-related protein [Streptosporangium sp. NBC_01755]
MIEDIWVDPAVSALRPDFAVLVMGVYGLRNGPTDDRSRAWLAEAAEKAVAVDDARVEAWREAYRAFGAKPQRTRPSVDALVRRMPPPEINLVVDAYNAISIRHGLPIGGEDLTRYEGTARLVRAAGDEPFEVVERGEPAIDHPEIGEVVWRDDRGVTCRRWNWRQCVRTRITEETTDALFLLERLAPLSTEELRAAGDELAGLLEDITPRIQLEFRLVGLN